jgi:hypothetical protein
MKLFFIVFSVFILFSMAFIFASWGDISSAYYKKERELEKFGLNKKLIWEKINYYKYNDRQISFIKNKVKFLLENYVSPILAEQKILKKEIERLVKNKKKLTYKENIEKYSEKILEHEKRMQDLENLIADLIEGVYLCFDSVGFLDCDNDHESRMVILEDFFGNFDIDYGDDDTDNIKDEEIFDEDEYGISNEDFDKQITILDEEDKKWDKIVFATDLKSEKFE